MQIFYKTLTEQQVIKNIIKTAHSILLSFMILIRFNMIHILMATILCTVQCTTSREEKGGMVMLLLSN